MPIFVGPNNNDSEIKSDRIGFAVSTTNPGSAAEGDSYFNSGDKQLKVYNGSDWDSVGAGGGTVQAVASGAIPNGATVVINTDGTVGIVTQTSTNIPSGGTDVTFNTGNTNDPQVAYDSTNQKVVVVYSDDANSGKGTAVVGTVSGTSISFGSEVIFNNANTPYVAVAFNSTNGKVVVAYRDQGNNSDGTAKVGTVSGSSISFGSATVFKSGQANYISIASGKSTDVNKVAITYQDGTGGDNGECVIGTISGTSISFGTPVTFESNTIYQNRTIYDTQNGRVFIFYRDGSGSKVKGIVGQISGTSISFGSASIAASTGQVITTTFCGNDGSGNGLVFAAWNDNVGSGPPQAAMGTIVGGSTNSITWGSVTTFADSNSYRYAAEYSTTDSKVILVWADFATGDYKTLAALGTISGTSVSIGSTVTIRSGNTNTAELKSAYDSNTNQSVIVIRNTTDTVGTSVVVSPTSLSTNLTTENFIGFSDAGYTNGQTAKIQIAGSVDDAQTGLTTGSGHFVQNDGTLSTTAGTPSVYAGTAISGTKIIVRK